MFLRRNIDFSIENLPRLLTRKASSADIEEASEEETTEAEEPETTTTTEAPTTMPATTKLLDSTGKNQLYVKEGEDYREATFADYSEDAIFYVKEVTKTYYGWQNIDGKMYYFHKNKTSRRERTFTNGGSLPLAWI